MTVDIDSGSGFCFGVTRAIERAEEELHKGTLYCLGDIVHNEEEVRRLSDKGLVTITHADLKQLSGQKVLLRAHGEPPATYKIAEQQQIQLFDASCPVVLGLQRRIREAHQAHPDAQIVIFGKEGHAEVVGLVGQTEGKAVVVENIGQLNRLDFSRDIYLFSQTTKDTGEFEALVKAIADRMSSAHFEYHNTICRNVAGRVANIRRFAAEHEVVIFVGGEKSSNAKVLYKQCIDANSRTLFVSHEAELTNVWLEAFKRQCEEVGMDCKVGICGATSTPQWLMERIALRIKDCLGVI
ncbi:MAG: 4-hydroxy-3-methylbut-2-enyl diphosphate reductase [Paludibacteraceae bacterium]|nr:4-hydroxy-3-methylbut-2-enyl diphosphate reductase [Paludibacteraceae bacterium]